MITRCMNNGDFVGANAAVFRDSECIYDNSFGMADKEAGRKMTMDTIFRVYSMTKPVTAVAAMQLVEQGKLHLQFPVSWFFPEFADPAVYEPDGTTRPAKREILVQDLLNMTSGLPYSNCMTRSQQDVGALFVEMDKRRAEGRQIDTMEFCRLAGKIPLQFDPGTHWEYGISADILGGVIEHVSGMNYRDYLVENIFAPLGMDDTDFYVPENKTDRFAAAYKFDETGLVRDEDHFQGLNDYRTLNAFVSGGAGLVSTIGDYARFANALANGGISRDGVRILSRHSVDYIRTPQFGGEQFRKDQEWDSLKGYEYGSLVRVLTDRAAAGTIASPGEFGWDGWTGTYFCVDPAEKLVILFLIQTANAGTSTAVKLMRNIVYGNL